MSAQDAFRDYREALRSRLAQGGPPITDRERLRLLALRGAWEERRWPGGPVGDMYVFGEQAPPSAESVEAEFGSVEEAGERPSNAGASTHSGMEYSGALVEDVVRLATAGQIGRTLRNTIAKDTGASTYMVDMVFDLMRHNPPLLADTGRAGWLEVAGFASATPATINLRDLVNGL